MVKVSHKCHTDSEKVLRCNMRDYLFKISAFLLNVAFGYKTSLISIDIALWIRLGLKNPFATNGLRDFRQFDKIPNIIIFYRLHLLIYGIDPLLRIWTLLDLREVDWIILHYLNIRLMFSEINDIVIRLLLSLVDLLKGTCS